MRSGKLRYHPARRFQRFISACVFLLKAKSLGVRYIQPEGALEAVQLQELLMQGIQALKISALDDLHLASYYAILLEARPGQNRSRSDSPDTDAVADPLTHTADKFGHGNNWFNDASENWQSAWDGLFDEVDLFADFTVFGDIGFDVEGDNEL